MFWPMSDYERVNSRRPEMLPPQCLTCLGFMIDDFMTRQYAGLDYKTLADARDQLRKAVEVPHG